MKKKILVNRHQILPILIKHIKIIAFRNTFFINIILQPGHVTNSNGLLSFMTRLL